MIRFIFRLLSLLLLAVAVIAAVVDTSRSLAASKLTLTSLGKGWTDLAPASLNWLLTFVQARLPAIFYDPAFLFLLAMPAAAIAENLAGTDRLLVANWHLPFLKFTAR